VSFAAAPSLPLLVGSGLRDSRRRCVLSHDVGGTICAPRRVLQFAHSASLIERKIDFLLGQLATFVFFNKINNSLFFWRRFFHAPIVPLHDNARQWLSAAIVALDEPFNVAADRAIILTRPPVYAGAAPAATICALRRRAPRSRPRFSAPGPTASADLARRGPPVLPALTGQCCR
jgi:hypothetical protein